LDPDQDPDPHQNVMDPQQWLLENHFTISGHIELLTLMHSIILSLKKKGNKK
jgi:hypothetical protein